MQNASRTSGIVEYDASEARKNARKGYTPRHTQPLKVRHEEDAQRIKERERERESDDIEDEEREREMEMEWRVHVRIIGTNGM